MSLPWENDAPAPPPVVPSKPSVAAQISGMSAAEWRLTVLIGVAVLSVGGVLIAFMLRPWQEVLWCLAAILFLSSIAAAFVGVVYVLQRVEAGRLRNQTTDGASPPTRQQLAAARIVSEHSQLRSERTSAQVWSALLTVAGSLALLTWFASYPAAEEYDRYSKSVLPRAPDHGAMYFAILCFLCSSLCAVRSAIYQTAIVSLELAREAARSHDAS